MQCHEALFEEVLKTYYFFVPRAPFHTMLLRENLASTADEWGWFLASVENIKKEKIMVNKGLDFTSEFKTDDYSHETVEMCLTAVDHRVFCAVSFHLKPE